jgi:hypothetical protein
MGRPSRQSSPSSASPDAIQSSGENMKTLMTRRELLAAIGIATFVDCGRSGRPQPEQSQGESTVTLTVDGMI